MPVREPTRLTGDHGSSGFTEVSEFGGGGGRGGGGSENRGP